MSYIVIKTVPELLTIKKPGIVNATSGKPVTIGDHCVMKRTAYTIGEIIFEGTNEECKEYEKQAEAKNKEKSSDLTDASAPKKLKLEETEEQQVTENIAISENAKLIAEKNAIIAEKDAIIAEKNAIIATLIQKNHRNKEQIRALFEQLKIQKNPQHEAKRSSFQENGTDTNITDTSLISTLQSMQTSITKLQESLKIQGKITKA